MSDLCKRCGAPWSPGLCGVCDREVLLRERDEARAEVERLERLFQQTHGVHHSWVDARHKVAERQREACARAVLMQWGAPEVAVSLTDREALAAGVRDTPLVTEGEP